MASGQIVAKRELPVPMAGCQWTCGPFSFKMKAVKCAAVDSVDPGETDHAAAPHAPAAQIAHSGREEPRRRRERKGRRGKDHGSREPGPRAPASGRLGRLARRGCVRPQRADHAGDRRAAAGAQRTGNSSRRGAGVEDDFDGPAQSGRQAHDLARADAAQRDAAIPAQRPVGRAGLSDHRSSSRAPATCSFR